MIDFFHFLKDRLRIQRRESERGERSKGRLSIKKGGFLWGKRVNSEGEGQGKGEGKCTQRNSIMSRKNSGLCM